MNESRNFRRKSGWLGVVFFSLCLLSFLGSSCRDDRGRAAPPRLPSASTTVASTTVPVQRDFVHAGDVLLPQSLGVIQARFDGKVDQPLIFVVGEDHVALPVQQAVADLLSYFHSAYDVKVICTEGLNGNLPLPAVNGQLEERRLAAKSELLARHINAVGYIALLYPDVRVIGVEDMDAYKAHKEALNRNPPELEAWLHELDSFLEQDASNLPESEASRVSKAVESFASDKDFERFLRRLGTVAPTSNAGRKLVNLLRKRKSVMSASRNSVTKQFKADDPLMNRRNEAMINATIGNLPNSGSVALVVGSLHLQGIADKLKAAGRSFVSILAAGASLNPDGKTSKEDVIVYEDWDQQKPTALESWFLRRINPSSTLTRA
jgi:hypothetical protein